jgi:predicted nucleic acid-binding protein
MEPGVFNYPQISQIIFGVICGLLFFISMFPLKLFFDADALIAGSASQTRASFLLRQLCEVGILRGFTCRQVVSECRRNLQKKLPQAEPFFNEILKRTLQIRNNPSTDEQNKYRQMAHPKDLPVLTSAIKSRADYLVTFNPKHYFPEPGYTLKVMQPGEALQKIRLMLSHLDQ